MTGIPVIAVFDIGKTNKKFFLIDQKYQIVFEKTDVFNEVPDEDGDPCDDITVITQWLVATLTDIITEPKFSIRAINFSTYGASFIYINQQGKVLTPLYNYLKNYPAQLKDDLYEKYGGQEKVSTETASPVLGSLNSGMQLYRLLKEKPDVYIAVNYALHLPQYASFIFTRQAFSEITSIGCHTQLWNFQENCYHQWVKAEGLDNKLAPLLACDRTVETFFGDKFLQVGAGLHDSSAALIPYLTVFTEPFILISTGTWCISLNPFNHSPLLPAELEKDCLCYMGFTGKPVKAARLFAGNEHEKQTKLLATHFGTKQDHYKTVQFDPAIVARLQSTYHFDKAGTTTTTGSHPSAFADRSFRSFTSYEEAYHCLLLDIMLQQEASTRLVLNNSTVKRLFVDGGFGNNTVYMHLLCMAFPQLEVYAASVTQATAIGAALAIHHRWNDQPVPADMVKLKYYHVGAPYAAD